MGTYYVSTDGSDSNPGTEAQPFHTISKGISVLGPGDTLYVKSGTYAENLSSFPSGTSWDAPVTIAAYPGDEVTVRPPSGDKVAYFSDCHHVVLDGFILDGVNVSDNVAKITGGSHHIRIQYCELHNAPASGIQVATGIDYNDLLYLNVHDNGTTDFDHGIYVEGSNNLIDHCQIHHNSGWGVHVYNSRSSAHVDNNTVSNNTIYDNAAVGDRGRGIILGSGSGNLAYNNLIWGNNGGIQIAYNGATDTEVYNNTIHDNDSYGIEIDDSSTDAIIRNNIIYQNGSQAISDNGSGTI